MLIWYMKLYFFNFISKMSYMNIIPIKLKSLIQCYVPDELAWHFYAVFMMILTKVPSGDDDFVKFVL